MNSVCLALNVLRPDAKWVVRGLPPNEVIEWNDTEQTQPTEDEINAKLAELKSAEPFKLLRIERNRRLVETDWTQLKDIDLDLIRERNWKNYRQALRDLPSKSTPKLNSFGGLDMSSVNWPDKPST